MLGLIFFLVFITTAILVYIVFSLFFSTRRAIDRLQHYLNPEKTGSKDERDKGIPWRQGLNAFGKTLGKSKLGHKYIVKLDNLLIQAHIPLKPEEFITIEFLFSIIVSNIIFFTSKNAIMVVIAGIVSFYVPSIYAKLKKKKILNKIDQQLPDTIMLISNSLKAGYSFLQAVDVASRELPPPISHEFAQLLKEINLGVSTEKALESLSKRVHSEDLGLVILAVLIQRQIGGNLSEILDNISDTIRSRIKVKGEIRILTAQGRISGVIISLLPLVLGFIIFMLNPTYIITLFVEPVGWAMIASAVVLQLIGIYSIRKIIRIEV
ncbi:MAG: type II secretion system F family protein [Bacillota bacterium]